MTERHTTLTELSQASRILRIIFKNAPHSLHLLTLRLIDPTPSKSPSFPLLPLVGISIAPVGRVNNVQGDKTPA